MKNKTFQSLTVSTLILLTGCASYHASSLSMLTEENSALSQQSPNVLISWKEFNKKDCQTYLGRNVLSEGYIPIQLTIRNSGPDPLYLSPSNFSTPLSSASEVASTVHTSTGGRVAVWGVGGLLFFPLLIPAFVDGFMSMDANEKLDADYEAKTLKEQTIQPHSSFNGVIFIPKEKAHQKIEMFLVNLTTSEKVAVSEIPISQALSH